MLAPCEVLNVVVVVVVVVVVIIIIIIIITTIVVVVVVVICKATNVLILVSRSIHNRAQHVKISTV